MIEKEKSEDEKFKQMVICSECGKKLPCYNQEGMNNFCPKSFNGKEVKNVCMACKMQEVVVCWRK
ncbi:MAG: hypothetical protein ABH956_02500 [Candidatus Nealsonbacteria bacterium]